MSECEQFKWLYLGLSVVSLILYVMALIGELGNPVNAIVIFMGCLIMARTYELEERIEK